MIKHFWQCVNDYFSGEKSASPGGLFSMARRNSALCLDAGDTAL
jgi:hypothetical protein